MEWPDRISQTQISIISLAAFKTCLEAFLINNRSYSHTTIMHAGRTVSIFIFAPF